MTKVNLTRTTWTAVNTAPQRVQVFGGRVRVADNATPAADDHHVWPEGSIVDVTANKWAQAVDDKPTYLIMMAP